MACAYTTGVYPYGEKWDPVLLQGLLSNMVVCQIYGCDIQAYSIDTMQLCTNAVNARTIAACSITAPKISANSIISDHIQTDAITATKILAGSIDTTKIAACTIKACNIDAGAVTAVKISVNDLGAICANTGCLTVSNYIQSAGYVSGPMGTGFCVNCDGLSEFQNICARGKFTTTVFEYSSVSAVGGSIVVPHDADVLDADMTAADNSTLTITGDSIFAVGDILRIKSGLYDEWLTVAAGSTLVTNGTFTDDIANWTPTVGGGGGSIAYDAGTLKFTQGGSSVNMYASQAITTIIGKRYTVSATATVVSSSSYAWILIGTTLNGSDNYYSSYGAARTMSATFTATATTTYITIADSQGAAQTSNWDNVTLYLTDTYNVTRDAGGDFSTNANPVWTKGTAVVNYGASGDGGIFMTANEDNAPYIDVYSHAGSPWDTLTTHMRMGNLNGFLGYGEEVYGFAAGDANAYMKYDPTYGLRVQGKICLKGANAGLWGYDADDCNFVKLTCEGFCMIDPADACNYSNLNAGALQFNDKLGAVPYVKRIKSGTANTGCVVDLCGWTAQPDVIVGIKQLCSYAAAQTAQDQQWDIYHDSMCCYITSATCYGYCFVVHAALTVASGTGAECAKNIAFDACASTEACTCASCLRFNFQYWCNGAAPDNYCYGTLCWAVCYKTSTADPDVWEGACCYEYIQPHASVEEIKTTSNTYVDLAYPCMETWVVMPHLVSVAYTDSGLCSSEITYCCCTCTSANCAIPLVYPQNCVPPITCSFCVAFGGDPGNVYCSCLSYFYCVQLYATYLNMPLCFCGAGGNPNISCVGPFSSKYNTATLTPTPTSSYVPAICFYESASTGCQIGGASTGGYNSCICAISQIICYCVVTGDVASCADDCMCSMINCYGCYCTLDAAGLLNWLAISYS